MSMASSASISQAHENTGTATQSGMISESRRPNSIVFTAP
jgi:hypothetical protein